LYNNVHILISLVNILIR